jgi:hypothetical protein
MHEEKLLNFLTKLAPDSHSDSGKAAAKYVSKKLAMKTWDYIQTAK